MRLHQIERKEQSDKNTKSNQLQTNTSRNAITESYLHASQGRKLWDNTKVDLEGQFFCVAADTVAQFPKTTVGV